MSTDVYAALFRIKGRKLPTPVTTDDLIAPLLELNLRPDQLEIVTTTSPELGEPHVANNWQETAGRRYELFSWLGCEGRGWLRPLLDDIHDHQHYVEAFIDDLDEQLPPKRFILLDYLKFDKRSFVLPLALLRNFNYDQLVPAIKKIEYEGRVRYQERFAEYKDRTFRELFTPEWFDFLKWTEQNDWDYLLYQFVD